MSKQGLSKDDRLLRYRWLHANMRLRMRYGIEVDIDEYQALCERFGRRDPTIRGLRVNEQGDLEGWVSVRDTWVCAHYKVGQRLIATFMPAPPPLDGEDVNLAMVQLRKKYEAIVQERDQKALEMAKKMAETEVRNAKQLGKILAKDLLWVKEQVVEIQSLLAMGNQTEAMERLLSVQNLSETEHPGTNPADKATVEERVQRGLRDRQYWTVEYPQQKETQP